MFLVGAHGCQVVFLALCQLLQCLPARCQVVAGRHGDDHHCRRCRRKRQRAAPFDQPFLLVPVGKGRHGKYHRIQHKRHPDPFGQTVDIAQQQQFCRGHTQGTQHTDGLSACGGKPKAQKQHRRCPAVIRAAAQRPDMPAHRPERTHQVIARDMVADFLQPLRREIFGIIKVPAQKLCVFRIGDADVAQRVFLAQGVALKIAELRAGCIVGQVACPVWVGQVGCAVNQLCPKHQAKHSRRHSHRPLFFGFVQTDKPLQQNPG